MIVILNNGTRVRVEDEFVQSVVKAILKGEARNWQVALDPQNTALSAFNFAQVACICKEEDIL